MDEDTKISEFTGITGVNAERAKFYLEAAAWDLQMALAGFYEGEPDHDPSDDLISPSSDSGSANVGEAAGVERDRGQSDSQQPKLATPVTGPRGGLATLDSIRQQQDDDDDSSDEERGQAFFAGGSVASGQQVLGPPKKRDEFIKELFEKAKEHGATVEDPSKARKEAGSAFGGAGYKLGDTAGSSSIPVRAQQPAESSTEPVEVSLQLWSTGFTIDNGNLRLYNDPNNVEILNQIKAGQIPRELMRAYPGREVQVALEDHRQEDYVPPKVPLRAFSGQGHMLGSPTPTVISSAQLSDGDRSTNEAAARSQINLTSSVPTTNIQFRLADGSRLVAQFNHTHVIRDLHNFINTARPQYQSSNYTLTLFPNRELTDMDTTIKDANILNSALIQKMKPSV